jgi:hypothetical protein
MAMSTETSGVDYGRYATYHTQKDLSNMDPEQWMKLVDLARDDLHTNYEFSGEEYPLEVKFETMHQRMGRHEIIKGGESCSQIGTSHQCNTPVFL